MKTMLKRTLVLILCLGMLAGMIPSAALAEEEEILSDIVTDDVITTEDKILLDTRESSNADCVYVDASAYVLSSGGFLPEQSCELSAASESNSRAAEKLVEGMKNYAASIDVSEFNIPIGDVRAVFSEALNSHPELYYVDGGFSYYRTGNYVKSYILTYSETYSHTEELYEAAVQKALSNIKEGMTDVQKALAMHDYLGTHIEYDYSYSRYNSYDALVRGSCVCQGYALAYLDLMNRCSIDSELISSSSMSHAWNMVKIGQNWYHVDCTWDDPSNSVYQDTPGKVRHIHFLASDRKMKEELQHYGWTADCSCSSAAFDTGKFWLDISSQIVMPDAQKAYYLMSAQRTVGFGYTVKLMERNMLTDETNMLLSIDSNWSSGAGGIWVGIFSYLSHEQNFLWFNTADNIYTYSLISGENKIVYTAPQNSQIYGFFENTGTATIALSNTPSDFSSVMNVSLNPNGKYIVSYDANGGDGVIAAQIKEAGVPLILTDEIPTRENFSFCGWAVSAKAVEAQYRPGDRFMTDADTILYAVWKKAYDLNGDGRTDEIDLTLLMRLLAGEKLAYNEAAADVNDDGRINAVDLIALRNYIG